MTTFPTEPRQMELSEFEGRSAAEACTEKAERVSSFDTDAACEAIVAKLQSFPGPLSGEDLTDHCKAKDIIPHDDRAFGAVFAKLVRAGRIAGAGYTERRKGHGTAGARLWKLATTFPVQP